jgi:hypothetical protein
MRLPKFLLAIGMALLATPGLAQSDILSEVRVGASFEGVELDENMLMLPTTVPLDRLHKASFEVLFRSPDIDAFAWIGSPKPVIGATLSLSGEDSWAKAGLSWEVPIGDSPVFVGAQLGATIHDGHLFDAPEGRRNYGCRTLFYGQATIGFHVTEQVTASLNFEHGSHAWTCGQTNSGFNSVGFKLGYKF